MSISTNPIQALALTLTRSHTGRVCVRWDDAGKHVMGDHTETWHAGEFEALICGDRAFVRGWTKTYPGAYSCGAYWRATTAGAARATLGELEASGYTSTEPKTRLLGFVDFAGGNVWHSWGEGANRCGQFPAPAQLAPVIASFKHSSTCELDRVYTLRALTPGEPIHDGAVNHRDWRPYEAADALARGEWTATDPMIAVDAWRGETSQREYLTLRVFEGSTS
jgi:hypothetical protein